MTASSPRQRTWFHRTAIAAILVAGVTISVTSFWILREAERNSAQAEFERRASLQHALVREVLGRYEDVLLGFSTIFTLQGGVSVPEFNAVTERIGLRLGGVQAIEWVPLIRHEDRAKFEAVLKESYGREAGFVDMDASGTRVRAPERREYYPIAYVQPLKGNEAAFGYDLMQGRTISFLTEARESRQIVVTRPLRLMQEGGNQLGVVMICPVFGAGAQDRFVGFLQCVFRVGDLLEVAYGQNEDDALELFFLDASEPADSDRMLYHRLSEGLSGPRAISEADLRSGLHREYKIPFGRCDWRVLMRPRAGGMEKHYTVDPLVRFFGVLALTGLLVGVVQLTNRRTDTIRREVQERTAELAESRRHFARLLQTLPGMAYRCTYDDQITVLFVSEGAHELTGWAPEDFVNGVVHFRDCIHPDDLAHVRDMTRAALQQQRMVEVEYRIRTRSGGEKWVLSRGRGIYEEDGGLRFFEGLAIDITDQKKSEEGRIGLERKLLEGQKLESLGLLAGGIAHDFNNLLSSILGNASLARMALTPDAVGAAQLQAIESAALRAAELCRQMLAYAGKGRFVIEPTDLTLLTEELLPLLKISVTPNTALVLQLGRSLPAVLADPTQLRQIIMNLVLNAADAVAERGGTIRISTGVVKADAALLATCVAGSGLPPGDYVFVEVRDTGSGMAPEVLAKIFDPFFTTKFAGRGLGLAAVLGIVRGHQGALQVASTPGEGSVFQLLLPPVAAGSYAAGGYSKTTAARPAEATALWRYSGNALIIEDEEPVRAMTTEMLKTFGFQPQEAAEGVAGLALFKQDPEAITVVLLDLLMPGMSGEQVLKQLRILKPDVRVLLMSGFNEGDVLGRLASPSGRLGFVAKPYTRALLESGLRKLLEN